jgi:hypothetical protein
MAWTTTRVDSYYIGNPGTGHPRLVTISDCVYGGTGYGGGQLSTGATGATGPTKSDLGFATSDSTLTVTAFEKPKATGAGYYGRKVGYDHTNEQLLVGCTAGTDISDVTYRVTAIGVFGP